MRGAKCELRGVRAEVGREEERPGEGAAERSAEEQSSQKEQRGGWKAGGAHKFVEVGDDYPLAVHRRHALHILRSARTRVMDSRHWCWSSWIQERCEEEGEVEVGERGKNEEESSSGIRRCYCSRATRVGWCYGQSREVRRSVRVEDRRPEREVRGARCTVHARPPRLSHICIRSACFIYSYRRERDGIETVETVDSGRFERFGVERLRSATFRVRTKPNRYGGMLAGRPIPFGGHGFNT